MRYLILFCFFFLFGFAHAVVPNTSIDRNTKIIKEETSPKKTIKKQRKLERKETRQFRKQTQKLKWQLLKNALKVKKSNKKSNKQNKKDRKPAYRSSRLSALFALLGYILFAIGVGVSGVIYGGILIAIPFSILALIHIVKSLRFIKKNPKAENDTYGRGKSIFLTSIGIYLSIPILFITILFIFFPFIVN